MNIKVEGWHSISATSNNTTKLKSNIASKIITVSKKDILPYFSSNESDWKSRRKRTTKIFETLTILGNEDCKVSSHGLSTDFMENHKNDDGSYKYTNREWLYDLIWYKEKENNYSINDLILTVECEWNNRRRKDKNKDRFSGIKYDFQKLLVANSGLKVMIFRFTKKENLETLSKYFDDAIDAYIPLKEYQFLFMAFYDKGKRLCYRCKKKEKYQQIGIDRGWEEG